MKKVILIAAIFVSVISAKQSYGQVSVGLSVNIGSQPCWGPSGYDHAEYYYLPDIECYYNIKRHQFVYMDGPKWIFSSSLPPMYSNFNLNTGYKVVLNGDPKPYLHFAEHREQYSRYKAYSERQPLIHESNEERYKKHWDDKRYGYDKWDNERKDGDHRNGEHRDK